MEQYGEGIYPHVCNQVTNNAITGCYNHYTEDGGVICTGDITGHVTYQKEKFTCGSHIQKLVPKFNMSDSIALFMTSAIRTVTTTGAFGYGRLLSRARLQELSIKLPVNEEGLPDYSFMEHYIGGGQQEILLKFKQVLESLH